MLLVATWPNQASAFARAVAQLVAAVARLVHLIELVQQAGAVAQLVRAVAAVAQLARAVAQARAVVELEQLAHIAVAPKCAAFQLNLANRR